MQKFKVCFELFGKKLQCIIECNNRDEVKETIKNKIEIHKVEKMDLSGEESLDFLKNLFGFK